MKNTILNTVLFSLFAFSAFAEEEIKTESPKPAISIPKLASLTEPGEQIASGDVISINRAFNNWSLRCDYRLSQNKRLCRIEQALSDPNSSVVWQVANSVDDRALLIVSIDPRLVKDKGLRMGFSNLEKTIPAQEWLCSPSACITGFLFEGFLQAAIAHSQSVRFTYSIAGEGDKETTVDLVGSMVGFDMAIKAGATDPFGRLEVAQPAKQPPKKEELKSEKAPDKKADAKPVAAANTDKVADARPTPKRKHQPSNRPAPRNPMY